MNIETILALKVVGSIIRGEPENQITNNFLSYLKVIEKIEDLNLEPNRKLYNNIERHYQRYLDGRNKTDN